ncbi:MAG: YaiO family outer membrane beta-barrel protein [Gracilimonas sp.]|uniref:YaiO family outer membrane beta-barrel protein n=1 Tax=Gracilimonas sp. TaxID=1974203 RepID=UPI0019958470|nr:YaiO family outer membrane beta-barrel protein [Gracilimonas sp.]MBD3616357.1 YaiO family outer membrane beta-barrel protein [Gracilimonas sp.]
MYKSLLLLCFFLFAGLLSPLIYAQQTPNERFNNVQLLSSEGKYQEAIKEIKSLISDYPENLDYKIQLGRIFSWAEQYENSKSILLPIIENYPENEAAFSSLLNTLLWSGEYKETIKYAKTGIQRFPDKEFEYQLIMLKAYEQTGAVKKGLALVESLKKDSPNKSGLEATETILLKKQKNKINLSYSNTFFPSDDFDPWHLGSISYTRNWEKIPTEYRLSYANIFGRNDIQFDMDLYPVINRSSYLYANLGFAPNHTIFPSFRGGLEYFYEFGNGLSLSSGGRILKFSEETIPILTTHLGKTFGDYKVQYRPFFVSQNKDLFTTHTLALRKKWHIKEAFLQLDLQYGTAPYFLFFNDDFDRISSKRIGLQSQFRASRHLLVKFNIMYEHEEYTPKNFRNRLNSQVIFVKRF